MTYEYVCQACGHQWEAEQSIKDRPLDTCVSCSEQKAKRLVSGGTGFLLKGGGWYADLYSSPGAPKADDKAKAGATAAKSESVDAKGSSDTKTSSDTKSSGDGKAASGTAASSGSSSGSSSSGSSSSGGSSTSGSSSSGSSSGSTASAKAS